MNKSEMTTAMFEEIKEMMTSMNKKIDELSAKVPENLPEEPKSIEQETEVEQIQLREYVDYMAGRTGDAIRISADLFMHQSSKLNTSFEIQTSSILDTFSPVLKYLKKRKSLTIKVIVFQLLFASTLVSNLYLLNENQRLKDNDLQLKYLKATNSVDLEVSGRLDTIFNVYRNEEMIEVVKGRINRYEYINTD